MAGDALRPLTTGEAKDRLRLAAQQASPSAWVQRHPLPALAAALIGGFVTARLQSPDPGGKRSLGFLAPLIAEAIRHR